jgi:hypothetical protein
MKRGVSYGTGALVTADQARLIEGRATSERQFLGEVLRAATDLNWLANHQRPARTETGWRTATQGHAGFPDIVLCNGSRVLFVELKSEKGKLTRLQTQWISLLKRCSVEVYVWRPSDWAEILGVLSR